MLRTTEGLSDDKFYNSFSGNHHCLLSSFFWTLGYDSFIYFAFCIPFCIPTNDKIKLGMLNDLYLFKIVL